MKLAAFTFHIPQKASTDHHYIKFIIGLIKASLIVCSYHVTYAFQSESTLYSCLNVKELLARSRREIWSLSDCNWTRTHNHLVHKRTLNHLAKLAKWLSVRLWTKWLWVRVQLQSIKASIIKNTLILTTLQNSADLLLNCCMGLFFALLVLYCYKVSQLWTYNKGI